MILWIVFLLAVLAAGIWLMIEGARRHQNAPLLTWAEGRAVMTTTCT